MHSRKRLLGAVPIDLVPHYINVLARAANQAGVHIDIHQNPVTKDVAGGFLWLQRRTITTEVVLSVDVQGDNAGSVADYDEWFLFHVTGGILNQEGPGYALGSYQQRIRQWNDGCKPGLEAHTA